MCSGGKGGGDKIKKHCISRLILMSVALTIEENTIVHYSWAWSARILFDINYWSIDWLFMTMLWTLCTLGLYVHIWCYVNYVYKYIVLTQDSKVSASPQGRVIQQQFVDQVNIVTASILPNRRKALMAEWLEQRLSDMECTVMIWRSWVRTPVGLNLECIVLLS